MKTAKDVLGYATAAEWMAAFRARLAREGKRGTRVPVELRVYARDDMAMTDCLCGATIPTLPAERFAICDACGCVYESLDVSAVM